MRTLKRLWLNASIARSNRVCIATLRITTPNATSKPCLPWWLIIMPHTYHRAIHTQPRWVGPHNQHRVYAALYGPALTSELFTVVRRQPHAFPYVYRIRDDQGRLVQGTFYEPELQNVVDTGVYRIERIMRRRGGRVFVKWLGYPADFNSWIPTRAIKRYKK